MHRFRLTMRAELQTIGGVQITSECEWNDASRNSCWHYQLLRQLLALCVRILLTIDIHLHGDAIIHVLHVDHAIRLDRGDGNPYINASTEQRK